MRRRIPTVNVVAAMTVPTIQRMSALLAASGASAHPHRPREGIDQIPPEATAARGRTSPVPAQRLCSIG